MLKFSPPIYLGDSGVKNNMDLTDKRNYTSSYLVIVHLLFWTSSFGVDGTRFISLVCRIVAATRANLPVIM